MRRFARVGEAIVTVWLALTLAFIALYLLPGDSVLESLSTSGVSQAVIDSRRHELGLDRPPLEQYTRYLTGIVTADLGVSLQDGRPVAEVIAGQASATIALTIAASVITLIVGLPLGILAAGRSGTALFGRLLLGLLISVPVLWTATLLLAATGVQLAGNGGVVELMLPALVLGLSGAGALGIVTEGVVGDSLRMPFVTTARAKGLRERRVLTHHVLRASASPILVAFVLQAGFLLGGVVLTEAIFNRPGLGRLLVNATLRQDTPVVLGIVIWSAVLYGTLLLAADLIARLLDPRLGQPA